MRASKIILGLSCWIGVVSAADMPPLKCVTETSIGAQFRGNEIAAVQFAAWPEFRIKPYGGWVEDLESDSSSLERRFKEEVAEAARGATTRNLALVRGVERDPSQLLSWAVCLTRRLPSSLGGGHRGHCKTFGDYIQQYPEIRFDTGVGKFTGVEIGRWYKTDNPSPGDSLFHFGTCSAYYD